MNETDSKGDALDSEVLAAPVHSEKVNENGVGGDWEIVKETSSKGDAWIGHH